MICVPIKRKSLQKLLTDLTKAQKAADLVEIWFDELTSLDDRKLESIFKNLKKPVLYKSLGDIEKINKVLKHPVDYIDLDIETPKSVISKVKKLSPKTKVILSFHNFDKTPTSKKLHQVVSKMLKKWADIVKMATLAESLADSLTMLSILSELSENNQKAICLCMGKHGEITRTTGHLFGNYLTYAPLSEKEKTAPGQIELKKLIKIRKLI